MKKGFFKNLTIGKLIAIIFFIVVLLTWVLKTGTIGENKFSVGDFSPLGFMDMVRIPVGTLVNFVHLGLLIVVIGGFYGIINETGVYSKLVKKIEGTMGKWFLVIAMVTLILLSSVFGVNWLLFVLVPLIATILFRMGYDKVTIMAATIGSILLGNVGATYSSYVNTPAIWFLGLSVHTQILFKVIALITMTLLYVLYVTNKADKKKIAKKDLEIPLFEEKTSKKSFIPLLVIFIFGIILGIVSMYDWFHTWSMTFFQEINESLLATTVGDYPIVKTILGSVNEFGNWTIYDLTILLLILSALIAWIYGIKKEVAAQKFIESAKVMIKPAFFVIMANIVFYAIQVTQGNSNIFYTISDGILGLSTGFNMIFTHIGAFVGSIFYVDYTQFANIYGALIRVNIVNTDIYPVVALILQFTHSLAMFILPTSSMLVLGLVFFNVSVKEWFSYIWKILIQLYAIAIILVVLANMFI